MILLNNKRIDGVSLDTVPVGIISPFIGLVAPQGYLLCQGQKVSKNRYKQLYNICKGLFGPETETEFYLPDLRGRVIAGLNENDTTMDTIGKILGTYEHNHSTGNHTLTIDEMPSHTHGIYGALTGETKAITNYGNDWAVGTTREWNQSSNTNTGGGQAHNHGDTGLASNYQPTTVMNYIVKAEMVIPNQSTVYDGLDSDSGVDSLSARQGKILNTKIDTLVIPTVNNTLISTSTTEALSAAQGKVLNDFVSMQDVSSCASVPTDGFTAITCDVHKTGKMLIVRASFTPSAAITASKVIATCTGYIPAYATWQICRSTASTDWFGAWTSVTSNGFTINIEPMKGSSIPAAACQANFVIPLI